MKKGKKLSMQHFKKPSARVLKSILTTSYIGNYFKIKMITNIFKHLSVLDAKPKLSKSYLKLIFT